MTNYGFDFMQEKLEENPNCFFKEAAFLRVFLDFLKKDEEADAMDDVPQATAFAEDFPSGRSICRPGGSQGCGGWCSRPSQHTSWRWR